MQQTHLRGRRPDGTIGCTGLLTVREGANGIRFVALAEGRYTPGTLLAWKQAHCNVIGHRSQGSTITMTR